MGCGVSTAQQWASCGAERSHLQVVIGDTIPHVLTSIFPSLESSFLSSRAFLMIFCVLTISYPLSLYRSIESLSRASAIALISMVLIIVTVIVRGPAMPMELKGDPSLRVSAGEWL